MAPILLTGYQPLNGYGLGTELGEEALPLSSSPRPSSGRGESEALSLSDSSISAPISSLSGFGGGLKPQKVGEPPGPPRVQAGIFPAASPLVLVSCPGWLSP